MLHSWNYQSLIHEFLGIENNVVKLSENKSIVIDERNDSFFADNLYLDFGSLGGAIQNLEQNARSQTTDLKDIKDIEGLKKFIHNYPITQKKIAIASKHSEIGGIISKKVKEESLFDFCQFEQSLVVDNNQNSHFNTVISYINNSSITNENALRISLLYCVKYLNNENNRIDEIKLELSKRPDGHVLESFIDKFIKWLPKNDAISSRKSLLSKAISFMLNDDKKDAFRRYSPFLKKLIEKQFKDLPYQTIKEYPQNSDINQIIVFFVVTTIHNMNSFVYKEIN